MARTKTEIEQEIAQVTERLNLYIKKEQGILSGDAKAYGISNRNIQKYDINLADVQKIIKELTVKKKELETELNGISPRRAIGIVIRDW